MSAIPLETALKEKSRELGFDLCGIATAVRPAGFDSLRAGWTADSPVRWTTFRVARRLTSIRLACFRRCSVVMLAMNYAVA